MASLTRREAVCLLSAIPLSAAPAKRRRASEIRRFNAPEATQAVAVDAECFYAIGNHTIAKYEKRSGRRVAGWECEEGRPLIHLNSGVVRAGVLYCAHSNYPQVPMLSSIEMWDTRTLRHTGTQSFGIEAGSATWLDFRKDHWYVTFGHYANRAAEPNRDARWTTLIEFDSEWRRLQGWVYPKEVLAKLGQYSISGGVFVGNSIFCTGHDNPEIYVLGFPEGGSTLVLQDTFTVVNKGQGIAWDLADPGHLWGIDKNNREIIVMRVVEE
jgi:hypothetical protein